MLRLDEDALARLEVRYPGITEAILAFERAPLPACDKCGSADTADVQLGVAGRSINISVATSKVRLIPNGPAPGACWCNTCREFFG